MKRLAVVGANGQVGSELVIQLNGLPEIEVVPVVRSRAGSAFLRSLGIECRIGNVGEPAQAKDLLNGCDSILNLAHSDGFLDRNRSANLAVQRSLTLSSQADASLIFCSTQMVYAPELRCRIPATYGLEKLIAERKARIGANHANKSLFVIRLGHVLGEYQGITRKIKSEIAAGPVSLPRSGAGPSNTVFVSGLAAAMLKITQGAVPQGTYDLISPPEWTWADVYQYYAAQLDLRLTVVDADPPRSAAMKIRSLVTKGAIDIAMQQRVRERLAFFMRWLPEDTNERLYSSYQIRRANSEIAQLSQNPDAAVEDWRSVGARPFPGMDVFADSAQYPLPPIARVNGWE